MLIPRRQRERHSTLCVEQIKSPLAGILPGVEPGDSFTLRTRTSIDQDEGERRGVHASLRWCEMAVG